MGGGKHTHAVLFIESTIRRVRCHEMCQNAVHLTLNKCKFVKFRCKGTAFYLKTLKLFALIMPVFPFFNVSFILLFSNLSLSLQARQCIHGGLAQM